MRRRCEHGPQNQIRRAHRGSETDLTNKEPACVRARSSAYMLWLYVAWYSCGTPNKKETGGCLWHYYLLVGPFSSYWVATASCDRRACAQSYCILLYVGHAWWISLGGLLLFFKGKLRRSWSGGEGKWEEGLGSMERGETAVEMQCMRED